MFGDGFDFVGVKLSLKMKEGCRMGWRRWLLIVGVMGWAGVAWALGPSTGRKDYDAQNYTGAATYYAHQTQKYPDNMNDQYALGNSLYQLGKWDQAQQAFQQVLKIDPQLEAGWYNLGNALFQEQNYPAAIQAYQKALQLNPHDQDARYNLLLAQAMERKHPTWSPTPTPTPSPQATPTATPPSKSSSQSRSSRSSNHPSASSQQSHQTTVQSERQLQARQELGMSQQQIQALFSKMRRHEEQTQQDFSLNPSQAARRNQNNPMAMFSRQQRQFMRKFFGWFPQGASQHHQTYDW